MYKRKQIGGYGCNIIYSVALDKSYKLPNGGWSNFVSVSNKQAAIRYLKANPKRGQIDIRGRGTPTPYCWKYWQNGKIIEAVAL